MLIGRGDATRDLLELTDALADGGLHRRLVRGEAGIGKTALLRSIGDHLAGAGARPELGVRTLYGRGDDLDRARPFRLVLDLAAAIEAAGADDPGKAGGLAGELRRVSLDLGRSSTAQQALSDAFVHAIEAIAVEGPVVLLLDDLQWVDPESAGAIQQLAAELEGLPIGLIGASRPEPLPRQLEDTFPPEVEHALAPLSLEDLEELTGATIGAAPGPMLVREVARSGGNPFFALEVLRSLREHDRLVFSGGRVDLSELALPDTVRSTALSRLTALDDDAAEVLRTASVLGTEFSTVEVERLAGGRGVRRSLEAAANVGLLEPTGTDRYRFRHDLVRASLYDANGAEDLARLHRLAALTLDQLGAPAARLAVHLTRCEVHGDATIVDLLERTARDLHQSSAATSLELGRRCLAVVPPDSEQHLRVLTATIEPLLHLAQFEEAERTARAVLDHVGGDLDLDVRLEVWNTLYVAIARQEHFERASLELDRILEDPTRRPRDEAFLRVMRAQARLQSGRTEDARIDGDYAVTTGEAIGDRRLVVAGWLARAFAATAEGRTPEALHCVRQVEAQDQADGEVLLGDLWHGVVLIAGDEFDEALRVFHRGRQRSQARGDLASQATFDWATAALHYTAGSFDDCVAEAETGRGRVIPGTGFPQQTLVGRAVAARVHLHRGDLDLARLEIEQGDAEFAAGATIGADLFLWAKGLLVEHTGDALEALGLLELAYELTTGVPYLIGWRAIHPDLVRLAAAAGRTDLADRVVAAAERGALGAGDLASARGCTLLCRGLAEEDAGLLVRATAAYRRSPRPQDLARSAELTGALLGRLGRADEAVPLLREAAEIWAEKDAAVDLARVGELLRFLSSKLERRRDRAVSGWDSLTPSERRVAHHVAEGKTTPEIARELFVSPSTVTTHIRHIFGKLGVNARSSIAAEVVRHRQDP